MLVCYLISLQEHLGWLHPPSLSFLSLLSSGRRLRSGLSCSLQCSCSIICPINTVLSLTYFHTVLAHFSVVNTGRNIREFNRPISLCGPDTGQIFMSLCCTSSGSLRCKTPKIWKCVSDKNSLAHLIRCWSSVGENNPPEASNQNIS